MATARTRLTPTLREEEIGQANGSVSDGAAVAQVEAGDATQTLSSCSRQISLRASSRVVKPRFEYEHMC